MSSSIKHRFSAHGLAALVLIPGFLTFGFLTACQSDRQEPTTVKAGKALSTDKVDQIPRGWVVKSPGGSDPLLKPPDRHDPETSTRLNAQALETAKSGKLDEAAGLLLQALLANKDNAAAWNNLGLVLRQMGHIRDAVQAYLKAITLQPRHAPTYKNLAVALEAQGNRAGAAKSLREYVRLAPDSPDATEVNQKALRLERNVSSGSGRR